MEQAPQRRPGRPPTGETPKRYLRAPDALWNQVTAMARKRGETATALVTRAIERELARLQGDAH